MNHLRDSFSAELLASDRFERLRANSLALGLRGVRRQRRLRSALHAFPAVVLVCLVTVLVVRSYPTRSTPGSYPIPMAQQAAPHPENRIEIISDTELLGLFPGQTIALIGPPGHQQLLVP